VKAMLRRENELRLSKEYQDLFASIEDRWDIDWLDLVVLLQRRVVREFGLSDSDEAISFGISLLQSAVSLFPDDTEIKEIPLYVKYNRAKHCDFKVGDVVPDVLLFDIVSNQEVSMFSQVLSDRPLVVIAGSFT